MADPLQDEDFLKLSSYLDFDSVQAQTSTSAQRSKVWREQQKKELGSLQEKIKSLQETITVQEQNNEKLKEKNKKRKKNTYVRVKKTFTCMLEITGALMKKLGESMSVLEESLKILELEQKSESDGASGDTTEKEETRNKRAKLNLPLDLR